MAGQVGMLGAPTQQLSPISAVRSDNLRLVGDAATVRNIARAYADARDRPPLPEPRWAPAMVKTLQDDPPRNATVERLVRLRLYETTTLYATGWPTNSIRQAKLYGGDYRATRLGDNAWRVERIA